MAEVISKDLGKSLDESVAVMSEKELKEKVSFLGSWVWICCRVPECAAARLSSDAAVFCVVRGCSWCESDVSLCSLSFVCMVCGGGGDDVRCDC